VFLVSSPPQLRRFLPFSCGNGDGHNKAGSIFRRIQVFHASHFRGGR
jgi:hypothetical protein